MDQLDNVDKVTALKGLVVADFSRVLAGPLATMLLADFGADVIKIERPAKGDATREWGPPFSPDGTSAYYLAVNRNKRSVVLDLEDAADQAAARAISQKADVVVENFRPGIMERFGLGFETLRRVNPRLIFCSISGLGRGDAPGYDFLAQAVGGLMSVNGHPDGPQTKIGVPVVDLVAGLNATIGVLAALEYRQRSGRGQRVDVNLLSSAIFSLLNQASHYLVSGKAPTRLGDRHPTIVPYQSFESSDGPLAVAVGNDRQFASLCRVVNLSWVAEDPRWIDNPSRVTNRNLLEKMLQSEFATRSRQEWISLLSAGGVPCGPVNSVDEAFRFANSLGLDPLVALSQRDGSTVPSVRNPIDLEETAASYRLPPPKLGEHTREVLEWAFSPGEVLRGSIGPKEQE